MTLPLLLLLLLFLHLHAKDHFAPAIVPFVQIVVKTLISAKGAVWFKQLDMGIEDIRLRLIRSLFLSEVNYYFSGSDLLGILATKLSKVGILAVKDG